MIVLAGAMRIMRQQWDLLENSHSKKMTAAEGSTCVDLSVVKQVLRLLTKTMPNVDVLFVSETEAATFTGLATRTWEVSGPALFRRGAWRTDVQLALMQHVSSSSSRGTRSRLFNRQTKS